MRVIGTAGHVDHGKSTLVKALTGINPDRLREEQTREMTIELGFAWMTLPCDVEVGIVDVPGHRDFIDNMLAGVGGIDAVLFVIAADEGVMPQTREHLAILDLLQIHTGIIVLTKCDLVPDAEWLDLVEADVREAVQGTVLEQATVARVSARNNQGLEELRQSLADLLQGIPDRADMNRPRVSIDRVFTLSGFGTVVTGTLLDGSLKTGDEVVILPQKLKARVRGLQTHKRKAESVFPGSRAAINLSGVDVNQLKRGDTLTYPGKYIPSSRMDAQIRVLADVSSSVKHNQEMKFFLGASETQARIRVLGAEEIKPGETGWVQLEFSTPQTAIRGDRYILRRPSPGETVGGGIILDANPGNRHKRFKKEIIDKLAVLAQGSPEDLLYQALLAAGVTTRRQLLAGTKLNETEMRKAFNQLMECGQLIEISDGGDDALIAANDVLQTLTRRAALALEQYHVTYPLRRGMPREELKSKLKLPQKEFIAMLNWWTINNALKGTSSWLALPEFEVKYTQEQQQKADHLLSQFNASPYNPPGWKECIDAVGAEMLTALFEEGTLIKTGEEVIFRNQDFNVMKKWVEQTIVNEGNVTVASFRDYFQTSRKYALALLEYLDSMGITLREGDFRKLRSK